MVKKIILWSVYAGLVGLLVFGAVIRTSAKSGGDHSLSGARTENEGARQNGRESEGTAALDQWGDPVHLAQSEDHDWAEVLGIVSAFDADSLEIELGDSSLLEISGRAWRYTQEEGFTLTPGDQVILQGFYENGEFEVSEINDLTSGEVLPIRDEFGTPLWSGRGR